MNMKMHKVAVFAFLLFSLSSAHAQITKSVSTQIQGIVPIVLSLSTDMTEIESVDLVNANSAYLGKVVVYTNTKGLWTIIIKSANGGRLLGKTTGNDDVYPYWFGFGSVDRIDLSSAFEMTYSTLIAKTTVEYPISISYDKLEDLDNPVIADTYSDMVTITVTVS